MQRKHQRRHRGVNTMDGIISALIGIGALVVVNIAAVAFSYGKLSQKVSDLPCVKGSDCPKDKTNKGK